MFFLANHIPQRKSARKQTKYILKQITIVFEPAAAFGAALKQCRTLFHTIKAILPGFSRMYSHAHFFQYGLASTRE